MRKEGRTFSCSSYNVVGSNRKGPAASKPHTQSYPVIGSLKLRHELVVSRIHFAEQRR